MSSRIAARVRGERPAFRCCGLAVRTRCCGFASAASCRPQSVFPSLPLFPRPQDLMDKANGQLDELRNKETQALHNYEMAMEHPQRYP